MGKGIPDEFDVTLRGEGTHDVDLALDLMGLEDLNPTITVQGGEPLKTEMATNATLSVPEPIRTEMATKLEGGEPIRTELSLDVKPLEASLDVKPVTADLCLTLGVNRFPPTKVCAPFRTHFGISVLGTELLGFDVAGENRFTVEPLPLPPQVAWGGTEAIAPTPGRPPVHRTPTRGGGLRVRLDG